MTEQECTGYCDRHIETVLKMSETDAKVATYTWILGLLLTTLIMMTAFTYHKLELSNEIRNKRELIVSTSLGKIQQSLVDVERRLTYMDKRMTRSIED